MPNKSAAHLIASWGYEIDVELYVPEDDWTRILNGEKITIRGDGYAYEGQFYWDYWDFSGGLNGELRIRYGSPDEEDDSAEGFVGSIREVLVKDIDN